MQFRIPGGIGASVALMLGSAVSLQFGAALAVQLFPVLGAWAVTALRLSIAALIVLIAVRPRAHRWNKQQWWAVIWFGVSLAGMNGAFYAAIERIPLGTAVAIEFLGPLFLAAALTRTVRDFSWVGLALTGMILIGIDGIAGAEKLDPIGAGFALVAAAFWAYYIRKSTRVGILIPGIGGLAVALAIASVLLLPFGVPAAIAVAVDPHLLILAVGTALLASVIPYTLELIALRRLPQRVFGVLLSLEPAIAALAGWMLLAQVPTLLRMLAIVCVVAASVGTTLSARRATVREQEAAPEIARMTAPIPIIATEHDIAEVHEHDSAEPREHDE
ncbi:EamA family transporter [Microbacterium sp. YY-01]|uniref:EamA family transporter n=1 Tax=Microbacterium sp. YY-01 TaxID=3421634 RepID=UPI003D17BDDB